MKIKTIELKKVHKEGSRMRAIGKIFFDNEWIIDDLRIIEGDNGPFIAFKNPSNIDADEFREKMMKKREEFEKEIMNKYNEL